MKFNELMISLLEEKLPDGKYDEGMKAKHSPESIAQKHGVSDEYIEAQLQAGIKVEAEHTNDKDIARTIALQHLAERPDYYVMLKGVENKRSVVEGLIGKTRQMIRESDSIAPPFAVDCPDYELMTLDEAQLVSNGYCYDVSFRVWGKLMKLQFFMPGPGRPTRKAMEDMLRKFYPNATLILYNLSSNQTPNRSMIVVK